MTDSTESRTDDGSVRTVERDRHRNGRRDGGHETVNELAGEELVIEYPSGDEPVVNGESIRVTPGAVTALVGPNGSGKSTLLKGLADQLGLDSGTVRLDGTAVQELSTKELARKLGLLSQENVSPDGITVVKLVEHGRYPHRGFFRLAYGGGPGSDRPRDLACGDFTPARARYRRSQRRAKTQLVWIAMVLAQETGVLLLDEPTTFLDLHHQLEVMAIVEALRDGSDVTVVLVLYDIDQAARYADHMVALKEGAVYARGSPEEEVTEALLADVFGIDAQVERTERGPRITPIRAVHTDEAVRTVEDSNGRQRPYPVRSDRS